MKPIVTLIVTVFAVGLQASAAFAASPPAAPMDRPTTSRPPSCLIKTQILTRPDGQFEIALTTLEGETVRVDKYKTVYKTRKAAESDNNSTVDLARRTNRICFWGSQPKTAPKVRIVNALHSDSHEDNGPSVPEGPVNSASPR